MSIPRILYLEDDEDDVFLLRRTLAKAGVIAEIAHVSTPADFLAALDQAAPDLILADGKVAGFGAASALDLACERFPHVPFYCLTGLVIEKRAVMMHAAGAAGSLSKQDLVAAAAAIQRALANRGHA